MTARNEHITSFLDQYIDRMSSPKFAVLLKGKWGVGKTWFINNYFKQRLSRSVDDSSGAEATIENIDGKKNFLYISLYGIKTTTAIDDELFKQIHPILSSRTMQLAGSVLKTTLKISTNFDVNNDGKPDGSLSVALPADWLVDKTKKASKMVIVFDDLERASMEVVEVLGYINKFLEHGDSKIIILANQDEIVGAADATSDEDDGLQGAEKSTYIRAKEKLIGREFDIQPDVELAIDSFISELSSDTKILLKDSKNLISNIYLQSGSNNLRLARKALQEFDRWTSILPRDIVANSGFYNQFLSLFSIFSYEIGCGNLRPDEISHLKGIAYHFGNTTVSLRQKRLDAITEKYAGTDLSIKIVEDEIWQSILDEGYTDLKKLNNEIRSSTYFLSGEQPLWVKLWHFPDLSPTEYYDLLLKFENEWKSAAYEAPEIVLHITGLLIELSEKGYYSRPKDEVVERAKRKLDAMYENGKFTLPTEIENLYASFSSGWNGLGYYSQTAPEFLEVRDYISAYRRDIRIAKVKAEAHALVEKMAIDVRDFAIALTLGQGGGLFSHTAILHYVEPEFFLDKWKSLKMSDRRLCGYVFEKRYEHLNIFTNAVDERSWISSLHSLVEKEIEAQDSTFARASFKTFRDQLRKGLEDLSRLESSPPSTIN
ncbi:hypothetical protein HBH1_03262 [Herbaspirillum sp. BH-1]|uniref:P-loop NTPase fold protein n=1 Tax=Herbaspirillum sp. (strain BH-1) TaxID=2058884 RepID=UPI000C88CDE7|nr:P-loop NTPase fold protein [Herbaspirillum sp. BH-1]PLY58471.1 hypothetical protein HBH1_03262 [Herbaspirillum sp. BH-1]